MVTTVTERAAEGIKVELDRRGFTRRAALGAVGGAVLGALPAREAAAESFRASSCEAPAAHQAEREQFETFTRGFFEAFDSLDLNAFMAHFHEDVWQQDVILGDLSIFGGPPETQCSIHPHTELTRVFGALFERFAAVGGVSKFMHSTGSVRYGGAVDVKCLPGTFFRGGFDLVSYLDIREGKIYRRNDYWDTAQVTPEDIAFIHPNGVPRFSCEAGPPVEGDTANAAPEMLQFTRAFHGTLSAGNISRLLQFFTDDALIIHPLLYRGTGPYGPFNQGIQIRGRRAIARFFRAVLQILPDGANASLVHVVGGASGGGYEWRSGGIYANQGIARNGMRGVTSIDLFGDRIQRLSVKFDTLQMTPGQRSTIRRTLIRECVI